MSRRVSLVVVSVSQSHVIAGGVSRTGNPSGVLNTHYKIQIGFPTLYVRCNHGKLLIGIPPAAVALSLDLFPFA